MSSRRQPLVFPTITPRTTIHELTTCMTTGRTTLKTKTNVANTGVRFIAQRTLLLHRSHSRRGTTTRTQGSLGSHSNCPILRCHLLRHTRTSRRQLNPPTASLTTAGHLERQHLLAHRPLVPLRRTHSPAPQPRLLEQLAQGVLHMKPPTQSTLPPAETVEKEVVQRLGLCPHTAALLVHFHRADGGEQVRRRARKWCLETHLDVVGVRVLETEAIERGSWRTWK